MGKGRTKGSDISLLHAADKFHFSSAARHREIPSLSDLGRAHWIFFKQKWSAHTPQAFGVPWVWRDEGQAPLIHNHPHKCSSFLLKLQACSTPPRHHKGCFLGLECPLPLSPITFHTQPSPPWRAFLGFPGS